MPAWVNKRPGRIRRGLLPDKVAFLLKGKNKRAFGVYRYILYTMERKREREREWERVNPCLATVQTKM